MYILREETSSIKNNQEPHHTAYTYRHVISPCDTNRVNPDPRNKLHRAPLSHAAENGHAGVVKLLLTKCGGTGGGVYLVVKDFYYNRTPLQWASSPRATNAIEEDT
jgi:ankyrin repeat protein